MMVLGALPQVAVAAARNEYQFFRGGGGQAVEDALGVVGRKHIIGRTVHNQGGQGKARRFGRRVERIGGCPVFTHSISSIDEYGLSSTRARAGRTVARWAAIAVPIE